MNKFFYILLVTIGFNNIFIGHASYGKSLLDNASRNKRIETLQKFAIYDDARIHGKSDSCNIKISEIAEVMPCESIATDEVNPITKIDSLTAINFLTNIGNNYKSYSAMVEADDETTKASNALAGGNRNKEISFKDIKAIMDTERNFLEVCKSRISASDDLPECFFYYLKQCAIDTNNACLAQLRGERSYAENPLADTIIAYDSSIAKTNRENLGKVIFDIINHRDVFEAAFPAIFVLFDNRDTESDGVSLLLGSINGFTDRVALSNFFANELSIRGLEIWYEFLFLYDGAVIPTNFGIKFVDFIDVVVSASFSVGGVEVNTNEAYSFTDDIFNVDKHNAPHLYKERSWTVHSGMGIILALAGVKEISLRRLAVGGIATNPGLVPGNPIFLGLPYENADHTHVSIENNVYHPATANRLSTPFDIIEVYNQAFRDPTIDDGNFGHLGGTALCPVPAAALSTTNLFVLTFGFKPGITYAQDIGTIVGGLIAANLNTFLQTYKKYIRINFRLPYTSGDFAANNFNRGIEEFGNLDVTSVPSAPWYSIGNHDSDAPRGIGGIDLEIMGAMYFYGALMTTDVAGFVAGVGAGVPVPRPLAAAGPLIAGDAPVTNSYYIENMDANDFTAVAKVYETL